MVLTICPASTSTMVQGANSSSGIGSLVNWNILFPNSKLTWLRIMNGMLFTWKNWDEGRSILRRASLSIVQLQAKTLANFLFSQSGTLFIYQGQELVQVNIESSWGIENFKITRPQVTGRGLKNVWLGSINAEWSSKANPIESPGQCRTPMQWNDIPHAVFTRHTATPWISFQGYHRDWNVTRVIVNSDSISNFWNLVLEIEKGV